MPSPVYQLADEYVTRGAALDPIGATMRGIPGHESELTDYSPEGWQTRGQHDRDTLQQVQKLKPEDERDRRALEVMRERLEVSLQFHELLEYLRDLTVISSPLQQIRQVFDLMSYDGKSAWETVAARMSKVPQALMNYERALWEGMNRNVMAARRQAVSGADQASTWGGLKTQTAPFFQSLVEKYRQSGLPDGRLGGNLERAARQATEAYARTARFLKEEYAPRAPQKDAAGRERYTVRARGYLGMDIDLEETYRWGWHELKRLEDQMQQVAIRIKPGASLQEVIELLETDPKRAIDGPERLRQWLQELMDRTIAELNGKHFDIPKPVRTVEAMIAPAGGAAAMYYTRPSEDFKRPGRTWYPTLGKTRFPLWGEVSTAYHEGVPGHHLQLAQIVYLSSELSRFQRSAAFIPGFSEGWALYAERLMGELGYLDNPDYELGMLRAQAFRAMRVVVDIGAHLELKIPSDSDYHPGETWNAQLVLPFALAHGYESEDFIRSEVDRYLGWPGQAICYKVGERIWLKVRDDARQRKGARFDLKAFHEKALNLGPMGLAQLEREFATS